MGHAVENFPLPAGHPKRIKGTLSVSNSGVIVRQISNFERPLTIMLGKIFFSVDDMDIDNHCLIAVMKSWVVPQAKVWM